MTVEASNLEVLKYYTGKVIPDNPKEPLKLNAFRILILLG